MAITAPQYFQQVRLDDGAPAAFAKLYSYLSESSTPKSIYYDEDLTSPCPQPLLADAGGNFPQYFLGTGAYRFVVQDAAGNTLATRDGITSTGTTPAAIDHNQLGGIQGGLLGDYFHMTEASVLALTDGGETAGHYHDSDRARANHTGTQLAATISDLSTATVPESGSLYFTNARADARITAQKGVANGLASLDSAGDVPDSQIPANVARRDAAATWTANQDFTAGTTAAGSRIQTAAMKGAASGIASLDSSQNVLEKSVRLIDKYQRLAAPDLNAFPSNDEGKAWFSMTTEANQFFGVSGGAGVLISVSIDGINRIMRSTNNGKSWTGIAAPEANQWRDVDYGGGVWVACALDGTNRIMRSTDNGLTWTTVLVDAYQWTAIRYGNGVWIAVSVNSNKVIRSTDGGLTWTLSSVTPPTLRNVNYGGGVWVIVPTSGGIIRSVDDGVTWEAATSPDISYRDVVYGNGVWVAISASATSIVRSIDGGRTWAAAARFTADATNTCTAYGNGIFVCGATSGVVQRSSDNGATWDVMTTPTAYQWRGATYYNGSFVMMSSNGGTARGIRSLKVVQREDIMQSLPITNAAPGIITLVSGGLKTFGFDGANTTEELFYHIDCQHDYIAGTDKVFHVHWAPSTAAGGDVKWQCEYSWVEAGGTWGAPTILSATTAAGATAWADKISSITLPGAGKTYNSRIVLRLFRNPSDAADTYAGDAALLSVGTHYSADPFQDG